jgi:hypothetical protein
MRINKSGADDEPSRIDYPRTTVAKFANFDNFTIWYRDIREKGRFLCSINYFSRHGRLDLRHFLLPVSPGSQPIPLVPVQSVTAHEALR